MANPTRERARRDVVRLTGRGLGAHELAAAATRALRRAVPFDGVCLVTFDPASLIPTGEYVDNGLPPAATARLAEIEVGAAGPDLHTFAALAAAPVPAAGLAVATAGDLDASRRHREVRRPHGLGDELRAALVDDGGVWGGLTLMRGADRAPFGPADVSFVASLARPLAAGLQRAMLLTGADAEPLGPGPAPAALGLVVLAADGSVTMANAAAAGLLAELGHAGPGDRLPPVVHAVASRARWAAALDVGGPPAGPAPPVPAPTGDARARARTAAGRWLVVRGSLMGDAPDAPVAVVLEPARSPELAPLVADAHGLTERERAVTELVARGLSTAAMAAHLHLSAYTVQDHLKAIFDKVGVGSRGELVARLFFDRAAPRLGPAAAPGAAGDGLA